MVFGRRSSRSTCLFVRTVHLLRSTAQPQTRYTASLPRLCSNMEATIANIHAKMEAAAAAAQASDHFVKKPALIAVSKTKPIEDILEAYAAGQRIFGENYVQELVSKSKDERIPSDIEWHFIGTLQSNKSNQVAAIPSLAMVETVSSLKLANTLEKACTTRRTEPLPVLVQINTSGEENKGGVEPDAAIELVQHIVSQCKNLKFRGVMTIGKYGWKPTDEEEKNPDFVRLLEVRDALCTALEMDRDTIEVSMGMSSDYEHAIEMGATMVRVGSTIFGARDYANKN